MRKNPWLPRILSDPDRNFRKCRLAQFPCTGIAHHAVQSAVETSAARPITVHDKATQYNASTSTRLNQGT